MAKHDPGDALVDLVVASLGSERLAEPVRHALLQALLAEFHSDVLVFNDVRLDNETALTPVLTSTWLPQMLPPPHLGRLLSGHPLIRTYCDTRVQVPLMTTDVSRRDWQRTEVADALLVELGVTDQLVVPTQVQPQRLSAWVFMRCGEPFSERERDLAACLRRLLAAEPRAFLDGTETGGTAPADPLGQRLTPRELTVLTLLADGLTADAIGRSLGISRHTVAKHLERIYRKLGVRDRLAAVLRAQDCGLLTRREA